MMTDLILMSAIVPWQHVGYKLYRMIYASIEKVIAHYKRVFLTITIITKLVYNGICSIDWQP